MNEQSGRFSKHNDRNYKHGHSEKLPREGYVPPKDLPKFNDPEFLGDCAFDWAIYITNARWREDKHRGRFVAGNKITTHQIRRYYSEFKSIERGLLNKDAEKKWQEAYLKLKLIIAKATYDANRSMSKLPIQFKEFIEKCVKAIPPNYQNGFSTFKKICLLFEAVVGYSSEYTRE